MNDMREHSEARNGLLIVNRIQDVEPYLEANKRRRNDFVADKRSNMRMVADIPNIIVEKWMKEGINIFDRNHAKAVQAKLNSSEYAFLRTSPGRCIVR